MRTLSKLLFLLFFLFVADEAMAQTPTFCSTDKIEIFPGGYLSSKCLHGRDVGGIGTTVSAASNNAIDFLALDSATGTLCDIQKSNISIFPGGYKSNFTCWQPSGGSGPNFGDIVSGVGTNVTDAGTNALGFAEYFAATGKACMYSSGSLFPGGYEIIFHCDGDSVTGTGSTASDAAENALAMAQLEGWTSRGSADVHRIVDGYEVRLHSPRGGYVKGIGTTVSSAARDAIDNAKSR